MANLMATAADKKRWDELHEALEKASEAKLQYEIQLQRKYGSGFQSSWITRTEQKKLESLRARADKIGDKIIDLLVKISPRGERWLQGAPAYWIARELTWEDAIRPANEPLSVVVPGAYGYPGGYVKERNKHVAELNFEDEDEVLAEMAKELDIDPDELRIRADPGLEGFGTGTVYSITIRGGGHKEWYVVADSDQERALAVEIVKQDLEEQPEIFVQSFIEGHINMDRLRRDLEPDLLNARIDDLTYEAKRRPEDFWDAYEREGFEAPEEDEEGERREPEQSEIEELAEKQVEEELKDPMRYLEDIYGKEDAVKQAIEIAGIDIDAAAEEAVDADGPSHFLSSYDGNSYETSSGLVYWRHN